MSDLPFDDLRTEGYTLIGTQWMKIESIPDEAEELILTSVAVYSGTTGRRLDDRQQTVSVSELLRQKAALELELKELDEMLTAVKAIEKEE